MKKMLMVATVPSMVGEFNMDNIEILKDMGYEVHIACNFGDTSVWPKDRVEKFVQQIKIRNIVYHQIDFPRKPQKINLVYKAYRQLLMLVVANKYDFIHCQVAVSSVISCIIAKKLKLKLIYSAHGFHYYKGAPIKNWIFFYPIEKYLSKWVDILVTTNYEDYEFAKRKMRAKKIEYVPGVGIDLSKYSSEVILYEQISKKRQALGVEENEIMMLSAGELSARKNHEMVLRALSKMDNRNIKYFICGVGELAEYLHSLTKELNLEKQVFFLGFRTDLPELYAIMDLFVFPSLSEGLSVALMGAIGTQKPVICSKIRGNVDLVDEESLFELDDEDGLIRIIEETISKDNGEVVARYYERLNGFSKPVVSRKMKNIYEQM